MAKAEWLKTTKLINAALAILEEQHPMTIRQLFYRLVSVGEVENNKKHYQMVIRIMTTARMDGRCRFEYIVDRSRPEYKSNVWDDAADYARTVMYGYRKDYWTLQPHHIELWVEKDAIVGSIDEVTKELGVIIRVGRGFVSTTKIHDIAKHFSSMNKPITAFYLGDHDPSGVCIERDLQERLRASGVDFTLWRLAIHAEDIEKFNLPPLTIKESDSRSTEFRRVYGNDCVELDALPPDELRRRIRNAFESCIDMEIWQRSISVEKAEFDSIQRTVSAWQNLPKSPDDVARG